MAGQPVELQQDGLAVGEGNRGERRRREGDIGSGFVIAPSVLDLPANLPE